jgi:hypothetical protein
MERGSAGERLQEYFSEKIPSFYDAFLHESSVKAKVIQPKERVSEVSGLPSFVSCAIRTPHFRSLANSELPMIADLMARAMEPK